MKTIFFYLRIFRIITFGIGIVVLICHMFLFGINKANVTILFALSAMLFLAVTLFKRDLNPSKKSNVEKNIQTNIENKLNKTSSGQAKKTYFHSGSGHDKKSDVEDVHLSNCDFTTNKMGEKKLFTYERIDDKWLSKLKIYSKTLNDGLEPMDYWYINHEKHKAIYYIGWVSDSILRCDGQDLYEFAFIFNNICIHVEAEIFHSKKGWDERNKLRYNTSSITEISLQLLQEDIKEAILFYLNNINKDRKESTHN